MSRHPCPNVKPQIAAPTGFEEAGWAVPSGAGAFRMFAEALFDAGYTPLQVIPRRKKPALRAWSNFCAAPMTRARIQSYGARWLGASLGVALGFAGVIALDVDTEDASQLAAVCGAAPPPPLAKSDAKGFTAFYRAPPGAITPSPHPAGDAYRWLTPDTLTVPAHDLSQAPADITGRLDTALAPWLPRRQFEGVHALRNSPPEGFELRQLPAFAKAGLARRAHGLASTAEDGRNNALFAFGAGLGRYVFHGVLRLDAAETAAIAACEANGPKREDGRLAVLATLHKGVARAKDNPFAVLTERRAAQCI